MHNPYTRIFRYRLNVTYKMKTRLMSVIKASRWEVLQCWNAWWLFCLVSLSGNRLFLITSEKVCYGAHHGSSSSSSMAISITLRQKSMSGEISCQPGPVRDASRRPEFISWFKPVSPIREKLCGHLYMKIAPIGTAG